MQPPYGGRTLLGGQMSIRHLGHLNGHVLASVGKHKMDDTVDVSCLEMGYWPLCINFPCCLDMAKFRWHDVGRDDVIGLLVIRMDSGLVPSC